MHSREQERRWRQCPIPFGILQAGLAVLTLSAAPNPLDPQGRSDAQAPTWRSVAVRLNGRIFADGIVAGRGDQVVVAVSSLSKAIDGVGVTRTAARLKVRDGTLAAAAIGGCADCPARVVRTVLISSRVREVNGTLAVPIRDVVDAFEGRLDVDSARTRYEIHVGKCTWCILEPSPSSSMREQQ